MSPTQARPQCDEVKRLRLRLLRPGALHRDASCADVARRVRAVPRSVTHCFDGWGRSHFVVVVKTLPAALRVRGDDIGGFRFAEVDAKNARTHVTDEGAGEAGVLRFQLLANLTRASEHRAARALELAVQGRKLPPLQLKVREVAGRRNGQQRTQARARCACLLRGRGGRSGRARVRHASRRGLRRARRQRGCPHRRADVGGGRLRGSLRRLERRRQRSGGDRQRAISSRSKVLGRDRSRRTAATLGEGRRRRHGVDTAQERHRRVSVLVLVVPAPNARRRSPGSGSAAGQRRSHHERRRLVVVAGIATAKRKLVQRPGPCTAPAVRRAHRTRAARQEIVHEEETHSAGDGDRLRGRTDNSRFRSRAKPHDATMR